MDGRKIGKYMAVVIAVLTVLTVFSVITMGAPWNPVTQHKAVSSENSQNNEFAEKVSKIVDGFSAGPKVSTDLSKKIKLMDNTQKTWVYVVVKTHAGSANMPAIKIALSYLSPVEIAKLSKSPDVLKIMQKPTAHMQVEPQQRQALMDGKVGNVLNPLNFKSRGIYQTIHHGAQDAWAEGVVGSHTTIAIVDTGVDFAQPNLYGAWAVDENTSSPYYGWPIVYDSWSMAMYLELNLTGMDAYYAVGSPSWYVNTSYNTTMLSNGTVYFNGHYYNVKGIPSASGHYHLGLLPETYNYMRYFGEVPAVLLVDSHQKYVYDTVYVDLDLNYDFTNDKPTNKSSPVSYRDDYNATSGKYSNLWNGGDGYPDWSGGMIYFIADGHKVLPGSQMYTWWNTYPGHVVKNRVPGNGNLVAFVGDFDDYPHGTACAANAASRGTTINGLGVGMAPRAKIIAEPHFWFDGITEWMFSEIGYDFWVNSTGVVKGFYDGDDAQISSNSWGSSNIHWDGWDTNEDRAMDYIAYAFPQIFGGKYPVTSFLVALGNGGPGYGTATSPSVQHAISVGAGSEMGYRQILYGDSKLYDSYYGDVVDFSARGPFANGKTTPDILATGEFGITPMALNYPSPYNSHFYGLGDGSMHFDLFSGTSMATPVAAGGLALIYDAYYQVHGYYPYLWTAKKLLMSSADDHNYDPFSQGPGWMNVSYAVNMVLGKGGIYVSPNSWNAGDYDGNYYSMFASVMYPGQSEQFNIKLKNMNWSASNTENVGISSAIYQLAYEKNITLHFPVGTTDFSNWVNLSNLSIPSNIDLMQVMAYTDYSNLDAVNDTLHKNPKINYVIAYLWDYINYTNVNNYTDRMRMQVSGGLGNSIDLMLHDPMRRVHGDMWYQLRVMKNNTTSMDFHLKIVGYRAVNWNWISFNTNSVSISGNNGTATVRATITVPNTAKPGIYEGKILVNGAGHINAIPVVFYVGAQITSLSDTVTLGGEGLSQYNTYLYDNSHVRGLYDWYWRAEAGDWRFFFLNVTDAVPVDNTVLTVDISWESNMTDIDGFILGNTSDVFSSILPSIFGPYTLHVTGHSRNMYLGAGEYAWNTTSGGAREIISAPLQNGLMEIMLHNVLYSGINASEKFTIKVYMTSYSPNLILGGVGDLSGLAGKKEVSFTMGANSPGFMSYADPLTYVAHKNNIPISTGDWQYFLFQTTNWSFLGVRVVSIDPDNDDIDLYLYYSDDGFHFNLFTYSATSSGDEYAAAPNAGAHPYWLAAVNGYKVEKGCTYNMTMYEGLPNLPHLVLTDLPSNVVAGQTYNFNVSYNFTGYHVPAGLYLSSVHFGPAGSDATYSVPVAILARDEIAPTIVPVSPKGLINDNQPTLMIAWYDNGTIYSPDPKSFTVYVDGIAISGIRTFFSGGIMYASVPFLLADGMHQVDVVALDSGGNGNTTGWSFMVDSTPPMLELSTPTNVGMASSDTMTIAGKTEVGASVTINGAAVTVGSDGSFSYVAHLSDGFNVFVVKATDAAGNSAEVRVTALYLPELKELWTNITEIYKEIGNLSGAVNNLNTDVSSLQNQVNELKSELSSLQNALNENVTMLEKAIKDNNTAVIEMVNSNITKINDEIQDIQDNKLPALNNAIKDARAKNTEQDGAIGTSNILGILGIILALVAIVLTVMNIRKKGPKTPSFEPEEEEEKEDVTMEEDDLEEI